MAMNFDGVTTLTFDCYGTLIDWEAGILTALRPLLARSGARQDAAVLQDFAACEARQQAETPDMLYAALLTAVHGELARRWGVAPDAQEDRAFGASIAAWPPFADTVAALTYLKQHFRLVVLSNVDRNSFAGTAKQLGVTFDAIYTAQDIGSYKPDIRNFEYLLQRLADVGTDRAHILHVAQSLFHDHAPANAIGLRSVWIDRQAGSAGHGATSAPPAGVRCDARYPTLGALAEAHRAG
ncbi:MAG: haloacid dehalogenase type II [Rhodospirillales bacterium]